VGTVSDWRDSEYIDDLDRLVLGTPMGPQFEVTVEPGQQWLEMAATGPTIGELLVARRRRRHCL
jgi:hypothetical protein